MSDLTERLRRQLTISMFATKDDLYGVLHDDRDQAADRIEHLERVLAQAREALEYHTEQTRPIIKTFQAIAAIDEALNYQTQDKRG